MEERALSGEVEDLHTRNREIGRALLRARRRARRSMRECASHIGTSRQRYAGFEAGTAFIGAVELESLVRYLNIPLHEVLSQDLLADNISDIVIEAQPGDTLRVVVKVAPDANARIDQ